MPTGFCYENKAIIFPYITSRTGEYVRSTTDFYNALESVGVERKRTMNDVMVRGIRLALEKTEDSPL